MHAIMSHPARVAAPTARARGRDAKTNARAAIRPTARPREISRVRTARESRLAAVRQPAAIVAKFADSIDSIKNPISATYEQRW